MTHRHTPRQHPDLTADAWSATMLTSPVLRVDGWIGDARWGARIDACPVTRELAELCPTDGLWYFDDEHITFERRKEPPMSYSDLAVTALDEAWTANAVIPPPARSRQGAVDQHDAGIRTARFTSSTGHTVEVNSALCEFVTLHRDDLTWRGSDVYSDHYGFLPCVIALDPTGQPVMFIVGLTTSDATTEGARDVD